LVNTATSAVLDADTTNDLATGIPLAAVSWTNRTGAAVSVGLEIDRSQGTRTPFMKYIALNDFLPFSISEWATNSGAIAPDAAAARGALAVGAVRWSVAALDTVESFSSRGPVTRLFDRTGAPLAAPEVRAKPELA